MENMEYPNIDLDKFKLDSNTKNRLKGIALKAIKRGEPIPMGPTEVLALILENDDFERQNIAMRAELKILQNALLVRKHNNERLFDEN